jgi:hypothetical protein
MAIGSQGEIGTTFSTYADYESFEDYLAWARAWREYVGDDLLGGYATLAYPKGYGTDDKQETRKVD